MSVRVCGSVSEHLDFEATQAKRPAIVVSDFRDVPISIACAIAKYYNQRNIPPTLLCAEESLQNGDFGDKILLKERRRRWRHIERAWNSVYVRSDAEAEGETDEIERIGIYSSAVSITRSEFVNEQTQRSLFQRLGLLAKGATRLAKEFYKFDCIFIFNGRTASTLPLRACAERNSVLLRYYECASWGGGYILPFPPHSLTRYPGLINEYWERTDMRLAIKTGVALHWLARKFDNVYTNSYRSQPKRQYRATYFVGSNDEYASLFDKEFSAVIGKQIDNVAMARRIIGTGAIAVRAHPNMRGADPKFESLLRERADELGCDFFASDSGIDSYSLIAHSDLVLVDMSSIAIEAAALGKRVLFFGKNYYTGLIGEVLSENVIDGERWQPENLEGLIRIGFFESTYGFPVVMPSFLGDMISKTKRTVASNIKRAAVMLLAKDTRVRIHKFVGDVCGL